MTRNEQLYEETLDQIRKLFSDTSVSTDSTRENLQTLIYEIENMIESLDYSI